ncbi:hypothetical protein D3C80_1449090 [compost metagenome]
MHLTPQRTVVVHLPAGHAQIIIEFTPVIFQRVAKFRILNMHELLQAGRLFAQLVIGDHRHRAGLAAESDPQQHFRNTKGNGLHGQFVAVAA